MPNPRARYLAENATEEQIVKALEVICLLSPVTFQQECQAFVAQEVPIIIQYLLNKQNPDTICSELHLCSNSSFVMHSSSSCQICVSIVTYGQQLFQTGGTAQLIIYELDSQCDNLAKLWGSSDFAAECKGMVAVSASLIAKDINKTPTEICSALGVQCSN